MKKIIFILVAGFIVFLMTNCNTPTEFMGQSNPVIFFEIPTSTYLKIVVNNLIGDEIVTLAKKEFPAGSHRMIWDGKNSKGNYVDEGFYHISIYSFNGKLWRTWLVYYSKN